MAKAMNGVAKGCLMPSPDSLMPKQEVKKEEDLGNHDEDDNPDEDHSSHSQNSGGFFAALFGTKS